MLHNEVWWISMYLSSYCIKHGTILHKNTVSSTPVIAMDDEGYYCNVSTQWFYNKKDAELQLEALNKAKYKLYSEVYYCTSNNINKVTIIDVNTELNKYRISFGNFQTLWVFEKELKSKVRIAKVTTVIKEELNV